MTFEHLKQRRLEIDDYMKEIQIFLPMLENLFFFFKRLLTPFESCACLRVKF